jgi:hypothetical protein
MQARTLELLDRLGLAQSKSPTYKPNYLSVMKLSIYDLVTLHGHTVWPDLSNIGFRSTQGEAEPGAVTPARLREARPGLQGGAGGDRSHELLDTPKSLEATRKPK